MRKYLILFGLAIVTYGIILTVLNQLDIAKEFIYNYRLLCAVLLGLIGVPLYAWADKINDNINIRHERR